MVIFRRPLSIDPGAGVVLEMVMVSAFPDAGAGRHGPGTPMPAVFCAARGVRPLLLAALAFLFIAGTALFLVHLAA